MLCSKLPKLGLSHADLSPYLGTNLFNLGEKQALPLGCLDVIVTYGRKKLARTIKTTFLVMPLITPYHCIVSWPTLVKLWANASTVHLKMKFHSLRGDVITISADLDSAKRCQHLALKGTQHRPHELLKLPPTTTQVNLTEIEARYHPDGSKDEDDNELARKLKKRIKRPELRANS